MGRSSGSGTSWKRIQAAEPRPGAGAAASGSDGVEAQAVGGGPAWRALSASAMAILAVGSGEAFRAEGCVAVHT